MSIAIIICGLILYYTIGKRYQSWILVALSLFVYWQVAKWDVLLISIIAVMVGNCALYLEHKRSKQTVIIPATIILAGFFLLRYNVCGAGFPLGYSVLAFTSISLLIDQYRRPTHYRYGDMLSYLLFFPKIFAGPIERASDFIPVSEKQFSLKVCYLGIKYLIFAAFCKFVISDNIGVIDHWENGLNLWMQVFIFAIKFFFDFWSYTLMAIGIGNIFGYNLSVNFYKPYYSASFREFWHRWNITLGTWLRDYIYIPLGGNRLSFVKWSVLILFVFLISGLWHGTTLPFFVWGICHGALLVFERVTIGRKELTRLPRVTYSVVVFIIVSLLWQLFIVDTLGDAVNRYGHLFECAPIQWNVAMQLALCGIAYILLTSDKVFSLVREISDNRTFVIAEVSMLSAMIVFLILLNCPMTFNFFYFRF